VPGFILAARERAAQAGAAAYRPVASARLRASVLRQPGVQRNFAMGGQELPQIVVRVAQSHKSGPRLVLRTRSRHIDG
jgi:hypothetical protein